jgi:predicted ABC-type ATPase
LWIVAGVNGAGKTTLTRRLWPLIASFGSPGPVLNPDELTMALLLREPELPRDEANRRAAEMAEQQLRAKINRSESVIVETVLSSDKYKPYLKRARRKGMRIGLIYVALSSPELAIDRIRIRVAMGGHDVPQEKVRVRWSRSLDNLAWFSARVDRLLVFSNDNPNGEPLWIADGTKGRVRVLLPDALPEVTQRLISHRGRRR